MRDMIIIVVIILLYLFGVYVGMTYGKEDREHIICSYYCKDKYKKTPYEIHWKNNKCICLFPLVEIEE